MLPIFPSVPYFRQFKEHQGRERASARAERASARVAGLLEQAEQEQGRVLPGQPQLGVREREVAPAGREQA
jgi:hypothetical protein